MSHELPPVRCGDSNTWRHKDEKIDLPRLLELIEENRGPRGLDLHGANMRHIDAGPAALRPYAELYAEKHRPRRRRRPPWLTPHAEMAINLEHAHLESADLRHAHLQNATLESAHLENARLESAHLENADLRQAHLANADLRHTHLQNATLESAHLQNATLGFAHMENAILHAAHLENASLCHAHLENAKLSRAHLENAELRRAHLESCYLRHANLQCALLGHADLRHAYLHRANLKHARLDHAQLDAATLGGAQLTCARLDSAQMRGAYLREAHLEGARLEFTQLEDANLEDANLQHAALRGAHLENAKLWLSRLDGATWYGSHLNRTGLRRHQLGSAIGDELAARGQSGHPGTFLRAREAYQTLKTNFDSIGRYDDAGWAYIKEQQMEKAMHFPSTVGHKWITDRMGAAVPPPWWGPPHLPGWIWWKLQTAFWHTCLFLGLCPRNVTKAVARRDEHDRERNEWLSRWRWARNWAYELLTGYGERPILPLLWAAVMSILAFPLLYWATGALPGHARAFTSATPSNIDWAGWGDSIIFSMTSFATLAFNRLQPDSALANILAASEAAIGVLAFALFVFTLGNRMRRS